MRIKLLFFLLFLSGYGCYGQATIEQDSLLRKYFIQRNFVFPVDYSQIDSCCFLLLKISNEKLNYRDIINLDSDKLANDFEYNLTKVKNKIVDILKKTDKEFKGTKVYSLPRFCYNDYIKKYIIEIDLYTYLYSGDKGYIYSKWSRDATNKNIYFKRIKKYYFSLI